MRIFRQLSFFVFVSVLLGISAFAQETQTRVVDEVVAVVNNDVITLSRVKREKKFIIDTYVEQGKTRAEAEKMVEDKQGEMIANLINEELLIQKGKEIGLEKSIEELINQRLLDIMKERNLKTVRELEAEMVKSGLNPEEVKANWRKQAMRDEVLKRELQSRVFWEASGADLKKYFDTNKSKFTTPETVSFSELFLGFAGRDEAAVREKARQLYAELKAGGDFAKIVKDNADPGHFSEGAGKLEKLNVTGLSDIVAKPIKGVKTGEFTAPFEVDKLGMVILRIDERQAASSESVFNETSVRYAILNEKFPAEQKKFMTKLCEDSHVQIAETYSPLVSPILQAGGCKAKS